MVLVTGATGILGRVLVLELLKRGKEVKATKRRGSNLEEVQKSFRYYTGNAEEWFKKVEWIDIDVEDLNSLREACKGVKEIYHCLAKVSFHPKDAKEIMETNVEGTKNLLYIAEEKRVKKFLFVSSIAVFDKVNESNEIDESSEFNVKDEHSAYAKSKYLAEMEVWRANAEGLKTIIINPGIIIGSGNWGNSSGDLFPNLERNSFTFSGGAAYVDVRDVAKIAVELMDNEQFGERFILIAENRKYVDLANRVRNILGKSEAKVLPNFWLNIGYILNILLGWLIPTLRIISKTNIKAVTNFTIISNEKIKKELDYHFISIGDSIDFHLKNYRNREI